MTSNSATPKHERAARPSRRSLIVGTIVVSIVLALLALGAAELVLRALRPDPSRGSLIPSASLGWDRTPSVENPTPATAAAPSGREPLRILFMGDSFTHNTAWSRMTIEALNAQGIAAMGWEAGVSGYGQVQQALKLEAILPEFKPDLVVLLFYGWNDPRDNFPSPGIVYNADMLERPYLEQDGSITPPHALGMRVRNYELFRRTALEQWWFNREMDALARAMREGGVDAIAANNQRLVTLFSDPLTWMPLYQPSAQEGAYMRGVWEATARAFARTKKICDENACPLIVVGIDAPFTIDRDVFDEHVVKHALYRADDYDDALPLTRFAEIVQSLGLEPVLPASALAAFATEIGRKIYDPPMGNINGHLLPEAQEVLAREVASAIAVWATQRATESAPGDERPRSGQPPADPRAATADAVP